MVPPLETWLGAVLTTDMSADGEGGGAETLVVTDAVLLEMSVSAVVEVTTAVLISVDPPGAVTLTTIETSAKPGDAIEPRLATTVPLAPTAGPLQLPTLVLHDWKVVPNGSGSVTVTPVAVPEPGLLLVTPST